MPTCVAALLAGALLANGAAALGAAEASTEGVQAQLRASAWLDGQDENPGMDKLASLKNSDPNAYAVVQALLKKQMLGMLNMRHPSTGGGAAAFEASMPSAGAFAPVPSEPVYHVSGAAAFAKFEDAPERPPPVVKRVELPYADIEEYATTDTEAAAPSSQDFMNWKAGAAEERDDDLVNSVLGMAANLRGGSAIAPLVTAASVRPDASLTATAAKTTKGTEGFQLPDDTVSGLAADEAMFGMGDGKEPLPVEDSPAPVLNKELAVAQMSIPAMNWASPWAAVAQKPPPMAEAETSAEVEQTSQPVEEQQAPAPKAPESNFPDAQASALESTDSAKALQGWLGTPHSSGTMLVQEPEQEPSQGSHQNYLNYLAANPTPHHRMHLAM